MRDYIDRQDLCPDVCSAPEPVTMGTYGYIPGTGCYPNTVCLLGVESSQNGASDGISVRQMLFVRRVASTYQHYMLKYATLTKCVSLQKVLAIL